MFFGVLIHDPENSRETPGVLRIYKNLVKVLELRTLELKWNGNHHDVSRIPGITDGIGTGVYDIQYSDPTEHLKEPHFHVLGVPDRAAVEIHNGCYFLNTLGCILVGLHFGPDLNGDGIPDITDSVKALALLVETVGKSPWKLLII